MDEPGKRPLILMVEDDEDVALLNARMLGRRGYEVATAANASEARACARTRPPDLFMLDIILPDGDGLSLCKEFREDSDAPVLFLTGKKTTEDRIAGLDGGGDYYLTKPYSMDELLAVIERLLQRALKSKEKISEAYVIAKGPLTLQIPQMTALVGERDAELTQKEFAILLLLVQNEDMELSSKEIYESVWKTPMFGDTGALRSQIARLKKKLGEDSTDDFSILYKQGKGYTFSTK